MAKTDERVIDKSLAEALDTPNDQYTRWAPRWGKVQDATDGEDAVKEKGVRYLPKTALQVMLKNGQSLYDDYKTRASFFNGTGRTVDGLVGLVYRNEPTFKGPAVIDPWIDDFTMFNQSISTFAKMYLEQVIIKNRTGLFVDYPIKNEVLSASEADAQNFRPFAIRYNAESILDWDEEKINNVMKTSYVLLRETERKRNDLEVAITEKRRVLDLVPIQEEVDNALERIKGSNEVPEVKEAQRLLLFQTIQRFYRQRVFEKVEVEEVDSKKQRKDEQEEWILVSEFFPTDSKGNMFQDIPFFCTTDKGISWDLDYSMINDLASVNVALYRNSADMENILHVGTNPTPCGVGLTTNQLSNSNIDEKPQSGDEQVPLGLNNFLEFEEGGSWGMLEPSGQGSSSMETAMDKKRQEMALLGARILAADPKGVEAAETAAIHRAGEQGVLASAVNAVEETMKKALMFMFEWQTGTKPTTKDFEAIYNKDFLASKADPATIATAIQGIQAGEISSKELFVIMQKGEWIRADKSYEDHVKELLEDKTRKGDTENPFEGEIVPRNIPIV